MLTISEPKKLVQYQTDYIISWNFDGDFPTLSVMRLQKQEDGMHVEGVPLGITNDKTGTISLRQVIDEYEWQERAEKEKMPKIMRASDAITTKAEG